MGSSSWPSWLPWQRGSGEGDLPAASASSHAAAWAKLEAARLAASAASKEAAVQARKLGESDLGKDLGKKADELEALLRAKKASAESGALRRADELEALLRAKKASAETDLGRKRDELDQMLRVGLQREYLVRLNTAAPVLRAKGRAVGLTAVEAMGSVVDTPAQPPPKEGGAAQETFALLEPVISPVLDPFIEGMLEPLNEELLWLKLKVGGGAVAGMVLSAAIGGAVGYVLGSKKRRDCNG